ncbi:sulfite exporter TauE/SafE family protein [Oceanicoccus sagamiensis]|uniref:Probable membrane transporter protein n=1 Tax=Oceanicoccus sagamiensis TaxID=716816 RepID=A0A1X9NN36_9GAMM|nr:sulfite exporter TauE/SafE family protein [Oceanicoccus sagamiensis]ARN75313.1 hypothetical protein BST96_15030 [Oceanicoccus sagamiensis]
MTIVIGLCIGLVLGLTGSGGSILAVPLFLVVLGLEPVAAIGLSLGVVAASALMGVAGHLRSRNIQWLPAMVFAVIGSAFTPLGHFIAKQLPDSIIMLGFSFLMLVVAVLMWKKSNLAPEETKVVRAGHYQQQNTIALCRVNHMQPFQLGLPCILGVSGGAMVTGILSGLFGVGGGFIIVPTLIFLLHITIQQAVATSLFIISFISSAGFINYALSTPKIDFTLLGEVILGGGIGMLLGLLSSRYISGPKLQKLFVIAMLSMALLIINRQLQ